MDEMQKAWVEHKARELQERMWLSLPKAERPRSVEGLIDLFDPYNVAQYLGVDVQEWDTLGTFGDQRGRFEVAAFLDRSRNLIGLSDSDKFSLPTKRFTLAHEVGHWVLHAAHVHLHRDRPIQGSTYAPRADIEQEADYFAACLLMPRDLLAKAVERCFGAFPVEINDHTAFALSLGNPSFLLKAEQDSMERYFAVASARSFGNKRFDSLAEQFMVSAQSMAIQLRDFGLVKRWP